MTEDKYGQIFISQDENLSSRVTLIVLAGTASATTQAAINGGITWLISNQNPDGSWGEEIDLASTAFSIVALEKLGYDVSADRQFLLSQDYNDTKGLALKFFATRDNNTRTTLLSLQKPDGGWGGVSTTSLILVSLTESGYSGAEITNAVQFLKMGQNLDGSWGRDGYAKETALATYALMKSGVEDNSTRKALDWLASHQQVDGSWAYTTDTAFAMLALNLSGNFTNETKMAADFLNNAQGPSGGWGIHGNLDSRIYPSAISVLALGRYDPAQESLSDGMTYILTTRNPYGGWSFDEYRGSIADTAAVIETLEYLNYTGTELTNAKTWILAQNATNVDQLSWKIIGLSRSENVSVYTDVLLTYQNQDGGWGAKPGYESDLIDTALAVKALINSNSTEHEDVSNGIISLSMDMHESGDVYSTSLAVMTLSLGEINDIPDLTGKLSIKKAGEWLKQKQNPDGTWGAVASTIIDTAAGYSALIRSTYLPVHDNASIGFLISQQNADGGWGDAYSTAIVLKTLEDYYIYSGLGRTGKIENITLYKIDGDSTVESYRYNAFEDIRIEINTTDDYGYLQGHIRGEDDFYTPDKETYGYTWNTHIASPGNYSVLFNSISENGFVLDEFSKNFEILPTKKVEIIPSFSPLIADAGELVNVSTYLRNRGNIELANVNVEASILYENSSLSVWNTSRTFYGLELYDLEKVFLGEFIPLEKGLYYLNITVFSPDGVGDVMYPFRIGDFINASLSVYPSVLSPGTHNATLNLTLEGMEIPQANVSIGIAPGPFRVPLSGGDLTLELRIWSCLAGWVYADSWATRIVKLGENKWRIDFEDHGDRRYNDLRIIVEYIWNETELNVRLENKGYTSWAKCWNPTYARIYVPPSVISASIGDVDLTPGEEWDGAIFPKGNREPGSVKVLRITDRTISTLNVTARIAFPENVIPSFENVSLMDGAKTVELHTLISPGDTREFSGTLTLLDLLPGEERRVAEDARIECINPLTNESIEMLIPIPSVRAESPVDLNLTTDTDEYNAQEDVSILVEITNLDGVLEGNLSLLIADSDGGRVDDIGTVPVQIAHGDRVYFNFTWNTEDTPSGDYRVHATLMDGGEILNDAYSYFTILPVINVSSEVLTDKAEYTSNEYVEITAKVRSLSPNFALENLAMNVTIRDANGTEFFGEERLIPLLVQFGRSKMKFYWNTLNYPPEDYDITLEIIYEDDTISSDSATISITPSFEARTGITGKVVAVPKEINVYDNITFEFNVSNTGNVPLTNLSLTTSIVDPDLAEMVINLTTNASLAIEETSNGSFFIDRIELRPMYYLVLFYADYNGTVIPMDNAYFKVEGSPYWLKKGAIGKLEDAKTGDVKLDREIDRIILHINKSIADKHKEFFIDDTHIAEKHGKKVFHEEHTAVKRMQKELIKKATPTELKGVYTGVIEDLVLADQLLAEVALEDAKAITVANPKKQEKYDHEIAKAEEELAKAYEELEAGRPDKAIKRFEKAWEHAQHAVKHAKKGEEK